MLRTFGYHYRRKYGQGVGKIPIDLGQPCPNRERGGCIFCRPAGFTPSYLRSTDDLAAQVALGKTHLLKGRFKKYFAYLQQETCTATPAATLLAALHLLVADDDCVGLILSTRPDYVAEELLVPLAELVGECGKECLLELGVQSVHDRSLKLLNRNHSFADFRDAAGRIREAGCFGLGAHLIFGIPGESRKEMLLSLKTVCALGVTSLKLHHLQVIRGTALHTLYEAGRVALFSRPEYLEFLLDALPVIPPGVILHRLWATAHPDLLVAPRWNCLAGTLSVELRARMAAQGIRQGQVADAVAVG